MTEEKRKLIREAIGLISEAIKTKTSLNRLCVERGRRRNFVANINWEIKAAGNTYEEFDADLVGRFLTIYEEYFELKEALIKDNQKLETKDIPLDYDSITENEKLIASYDAYDDESYDERSFGEPVRDGEEILLSDGKTVTKKITSYYYCIKIKGSNDLVGELTRE